MGGPESGASRETLYIAGIGQPTLALQVQRPTSATANPRESGDVVYVHGATFGADLSIFFRFDGRSWADAINDIGLTVWGFDFPGYGRSERYSDRASQPAGRMEDVIPQLRRVIAAVRERNGDRPVILVSHSWGASVAARYAGIYPQDVRALVMFAPIVTRVPIAPQAATVTQPSHYLLTLWAQYRRFIEDVPRGHSQALSESHIQEWGTAYLATDPSSEERTPPSVLTPYGPLADIGAMWSGKSLYDLSLITAPVLLVRGKWDSTCNDADAENLMSRTGSKQMEEVEIERAGHLLHFEVQRTVLHDQVNRFLKRVSQ